MAAAQNGDEVFRQLSRLTEAVGGLSSDVKHLEKKVADIERQAEDNANTARADASKTRDLFTGGRVVRFILITIGGLLGGVVALGRDTWREIVRPWFQ